MSERIQKRSRERAKAAREREQNALKRAETSRERGHQQAARSQEDSAHKHAIAARAAEELIEIDSRIEGDKLGDRDELAAEG